MRVVIACDQAGYEEAFRNVIEAFPAAWDGMQVEIVTLTDRDRAAVADLLVVAVTPHKVGHASFREIIRGLRRRPSSVCFLINEREQLQEAEEAMLRQELADSLGGRFEGAPVLLFSTMAAQLAHHLITHGRVTDRGAEAMRRSFLEATGLETLPDAETVLDWSGLSELLAQGAALARTPEARAGKPICLCVAGSPDVGLDSVTAWLAAHLPDWAILPRLVTAGEPLDEGLQRQADALLLVTGPRWDRDLPALGHLARRPSAWILINRADEAPLYGHLAERWLRGATERAAAIGLRREQLLLTSSYYAVQLDALGAGSRTEADLLADSQLLVLDEWGLPLPKRAYPERLLPQLSEHGLNPLLANLQEVIGC